MAKVVHLTSVHKPLDVRIFRKECRTLADVGHEVTLIAPSSGNEKRDGVQIIGVDQPENRWERVCITGRKVVRRAGGIDADVYHLHDPELLPWSWLFLEGGEAPVIYDMHEDFVAQLKTKDWIPSSIRPLLSGIIRIGLRVFLHDRSVIFAESSYKSRYDWLRRTTTVQNMPIVSELTDIGKPKYSKPTLGYIGSVRPDRGSRVMLHALRILQKEGYEVGFECVGPAAPEHREELIDMQSRSGIRNVRMPGYLPPEQGWNRMARCHVGIAMLEKTPNFVGSYPTKLFEYMALGLPVVTSDIPIYRDVVENSGCGLVADPESPEDVADKVATLISDPERARYMGGKGRRAVQDNFNWKKEGEKLVQFYDTIIATRE
jgi:glycosyltransferase involved in cell wall biosynthesis